ncbi:hypothetical protein CDG76_17295 [Nostoc sp. 'Peltigera membranacea cyanobiont' 210A]|nr:hypothetical protein CDG76_17295 [Nostoc sp. 'Peltigera membranacea cyanobiont' 210A]
MPTAVNYAQKFLTRENKGVEMYGDRNTSQIISLEILSDRLLVILRLFFKAIILNLLARPLTTDNTYTTFVIQVNFHEGVSFHQ